jgi:hypothetical protein
VRSKAGVESTDEVLDRMAGLGSVPAETFPVTNRSRSVGFLDDRGVSRRGAVERDLLAQPG